MSAVTIALVSDLHRAAFVDSELRVSYSPLARRSQPCDVVGQFSPGCWLSRLYSLWCTSTVRPKCGNYVISSAIRGWHCVSPDHVSNRIETLLKLPKIKYITTHSPKKNMYPVSIYIRERFCQPSKWPGIPQYGHTHTRCPYWDQMHTENWDTGNDSESARGENTYI